MARAVSDVVVKRRLWDELLARAHKLEHAFVKVGVLASKGGTDTHADGEMTLIEIAATHEFGSEAAGIPERSFIRSTFERRVAKELADFQAKLAKAIVTKGLDPMRALAMLGAWGAAEVKKTITESDLEPPLKPATIAAREHGGTKPLLDTGQLKNSITYEVVEREESES